VPELSCDQRRQFRLQPCDADGNPPPREPYPMPEPPPPVEPLLTLRVGDEVFVNNTNDERLRLRSAPTTSTNANILMILEDGTRATLLEGPRAAEGFTWWQIRTDEGAEGWVVSYIEDSVELLQTLVPVRVFGF
jgi:hypothetical protein